MILADVTILLTNEFNAMVKDLIAAYDAKGMRASGKWADGLEVVVEDTNAKIIGLPYSQQLETGRAPGKQPPSKAIEEWIYNKGIFAATLQRMTISSLAFLIARKIAQNGWKREQHGGVNLISDVVTPSRIQSIIDKVGYEYTNQFVTSINFDLKNLAA